MAEYNAHDLAVREQAFKEAHQQITDFMDELRSGTEGHAASWRTEATSDALDFAAMRVNRLAGWARAELDAAEDQLDMGGDPILWPRYRPSAIDSKGACHGPVHPEVPEV